MQNKKVQILSTKIINEVLLAKASHHAIDITCLPFIETVPVTDTHIIQTINDMAGNAVTAIFTSAQSVSSVAALLAKEAQNIRWNIYCLFGATKEQVVLHFPRATVHATAADSAALGDEMLKDEVKEAHFFCGDKRMDTIPEKLAQRNVNLKQYIVYVTRELSHKIDREYDGILFFSPSAVRSFCSVNKIEKDTACFAVGNTTARSLQPVAKNIIVAATASGQAMIEKVKEKFGKI